MVFFQQVTANAQFFNGLGDGTSWNDADNWDGGIPGSDPDQFPFAFIGGFFGGPPLPGVSLFDVEINTPTSVDLVNLGDSSLSFNAETTLENLGATNAVVNINSDVSVGLQGGFQIGNGSQLNLNSGTLSGGLTVGGSNFFGPPVGGVPVAPTINRNGGVLDLGFLGIVGPSNFSLAASDRVDGQIQLDAGADFQINTNRSIERLDISDSTLSVNAELNVGTNAINLRNGTLNLNSGTLSGSLSVDSVQGLSGVSQINQNGGRLNLDSLNLIAPISLTIAGDDNVSGSIGLGEGTALTVNRALELSGAVNVPETATLNINGNLTAGELRLVGTLNRGAGVQLDVNRLSLVRREYDFDGTDQIQTFLDATDNSTVTVSTPLPEQTGFGFQLDVGDNSTANIDSQSDLQHRYGRISAAGNSTININEATNSSQVTAVDSTVNVNADLTTGTANGLRSFGGVVNLSGGTLSGRLELSNRTGSGTAIGAASTFSRTSDASLDLSELVVRGATEMDFLEGDSIDRISLTDNARFEVIQSLGQMNGLETETFSFAISEDSNLHLTFDDMLAAEGMLDYGLRLPFDQVNLLQNFLDDGRITFSGSPGDIRVIRDLGSFGDFTYVGYVSTSAVPEPSCIALLVGIIGTISGRRRRTLTSNL